MTPRVESTRCVYEVSFNREKSFTQMKILDYLAVYMFIFLQTGYGTAECTCRLQPFSLAISSSIYRATVPIRYSNKLYDFLTGKMS